MEIHKVTIRGTRPLLMHSGRLKDPLDEWSKKLKVETSKRSKSDEDHIYMSRIEFEGGMYFDPKLGPYLPTDNLQACIIEGARKRKLGKQFEALVEVVSPMECDGYALEYKGPRDVEALWNSRDFVMRKDAKVNGSSVMRTRPRFPAGWRVSFEVEVMDGGASPEQLRQSLDDAGALIGLGDWTPKYGRFVVEKFDGKVLDKAA